MWILNRFFAKWLIHICSWLFEWIHNNFFHITLLMHVYYQISWKFEWFFLFTRKSNKTHFDDVDKRFAFDSESLTVNVTIDRNGRINHKIQIANCTPSMCARSDSLKWTNRWRCACSHSSQAEMNVYGGVDSTNGST